MASRSYREQGGEHWALRAVLEKTNLLCVPVTLEAGHTSFELEQALAEQHEADYVLRITGNCEKTFETLRGIDWAAGRNGATSNRAGSGRGGGVGCGARSRCSRRIRSCCPSGMRAKRSGSSTRVAAGGALTGRAEQQSQSGP